MRKRPLRELLTHCVHSIDGKSPSSLQYIWAELFRERVEIARIIITTCLNIRLMNHLIIMTYEYLLTKNEYVLWNRYPIMVKRILNSPHSNTKYLVFDYWEYISTVIFFFDILNANVPVLFSLLAWLPNRCWSKQSKQTAIHWCIHLICSVLSFFFSFCLLISIFSALLPHFDGKWAPFFRHLLWCLLSVWFISYANVLF